MGSRRKSAFAEPSASAACLDCMRPQNNKNDYLDYLDALDFEELLELESKTPDDVDLLVRIGGGYFKRRELDKTRDYYDRALEIDPNDGWTHTFMGNLLYGLRQYRDAIAAFKRAIELMPTVACPYWCLADVYNAHGNFALAEVNYNRAVEIDPDNKIARQRLADWNDRYASDA